MTAHGRPHDPAAAGRGAAAAVRRRRAVAGGARCRRRDGDRPAGQGHRCRSTAGRAISRSSPRSRRARRSSSRAGATLVALYLDAGDEYVFKGPSAIEFKPGQPDVQSGAKPERHSLALGKGGKDVRIKPVGMTQGAMVMRSVRPVARIQLLTLNRTRTLETSPGVSLEGAAAGTEVRVRAQRRHRAQRVRNAGRRHVAEAPCRRAAQGGRAVHVGSVGPPAR